MKHVKVTTKFKGSIYLLASSIINTHRHRIYYNIWLSQQVIGTYVADWLILKPN